MTDHTTLCRRSDIPDGAGRGFSVDRSGSRLGILIVRQGERIYAYHNICPHKGLNLDWKPDAFMDLSGQYIQCANHDALFRIEDGVCVSGPCYGARLKPFPVTVNNNGMVETAPGNST